MRNSHEREGSVGTIVVISLLVVLLLSAIGFGVWAFSERATYKDNSDQKSAEAVEAALEVQKVELEKAFDEKEKQPFENYQGPTELGSMVVTYPKTWELYVDSGKNGNAVLSGYAHPGYVPSVNGDTSFALRFEVVDDEYTDVLNDYSNDVKRGTIRAVPFRAEKVPSVLGSKLEGEIGQDKTGTVVILPVRDKTLRIWTEGPSFVADFNTVLANLTFSP